MKSLMKSKGKFRFLVYPEIDQIWTSMKSLMKYKIKPRFLVYPEIYHFQTKNYDLNISTRTTHILQLVSVFCFLLVCIEVFIERNTVLFSQDTHINLTFTSLNTKSKGMKVTWNFCILAKEILFFKMSYLYR